MRVAIVEGADAGWLGGAVLDQIGLVLADGCEFWCSDDFSGFVIVEANSDEVASADAGGAAAGLTS